MHRPRRALVLVALALLVRLADARALPSKLTDADFWRIVSEFSEPGGYFPSHNFVSNEMEYQTVIPRLGHTVKPGGVYLGVGPDQNFTYIASLRPAMVFIVDIREQNLLQHLLYKALMEMSPTRAEFLSRLFGRTKPGEVDDGMTAAALLNLYGRAEPSAELHAETSRRVFDVLERQHKFDLTADERDTITFLLDTFFAWGPEITYAPVDFDRPFFATSGMRISMFPSFGELMTRTDKAGRNHSYLASEAHYAVVRDLQRRNLIIPIVGDFAGEHALASVGRYVESQGAVVTAIYTSNVEQYLFQNDLWRRYYDNVAALPTDGTSTFIRSFFPHGGRIRMNPLVTTYVPGVSMTAPSLYLYPESVSLLSPVGELVTAVTDGRISGYLDVIDMSK